MSPSTNTKSRPTASIETLAIVPPTPLTPPYITKYDLNKNINYIHTDIKYDINAINDNIPAMIQTLTDTNDKKNNQEENITDLSSKLPTYEDLLDKMSINETQLQPLIIQVKNDQDEKIT